MRTIHSCIITCLYVIVSLCQSEQPILWTLKTPVFLRETAIMFCTKKGNSTPTHMVWTKQDHLIAVNNDSLNVEKYDVFIKYNRTAMMYYLVIKNIQIEDLNLLYKCDLDFLSAKGSFPLNEDTVVAHPKKEDISSNVTYEEGHLKCDIVFSRVYPKPKCIATFKDNIITKYAETNYTEKNSLYSMTFHLFYESNECGEFDVSCVIGKDETSILHKTHKVEHCKDLSTSQSIVGKILSVSEITGVVTGVLLVTMITIVTCVCFYRHSKKKSTKGIAEGRELTHVDDFIGDPSNIECTAGNAALFARKTDPVKRLKDDKYLTDAYGDRKEILSDESEHRIILMNEQLSDSEEYNVQICESFGKVQLQITDHFTKDPSDLECTEGYDAIFTFKVNPNSPPVKCLKDGKDITADDRHEILSDESEYKFTLKNTQLSDSGEYRIQVGKSSRKVQLQIKDPIDEEPLDMECIKGKDVTISRKVIPNSPPVKMLKDGKDITDDDRYEILSDESEYKIILKNTQLSDSGEYNIQVGKSSRKVQLQIKDITNAEIELWKEQDSGFVETPIVKHILQKFKSELFVLLVGVSGIGKTVLVHHVALKLYYKNDYTIIHCECVQDILEHYKKEERQVFVLDDACGRYTANLSFVEYLKKNEKTFKQIFKRGKTKIVATCRLDIYNDIKIQGYETFLNANTVCLSMIYSREDKLLISSKYFKNTDVQLLKDRNVEFTPLMCNLYSGNSNFNIFDFLHCHCETQKQEWDKLKSNNQYKLCSLFLFVIYNSKLPESLFDIGSKSYAKKKTVLENIFKFFGLNIDTACQKIKSFLDSGIGTYLRKINSVYEVITAEMFDFMCCYFGKTDVLVTFTLQYAHIKVLIERTQLESLGVYLGTYTILISKDHEQEYFKRIKRELETGYMSRYVCSSHMKHAKYRALFIEILMSIDDELLHKLINEIETEEHGDNDDEDNIVLTEGPLITCCSRGYHDVVQYFISKGADVKKCFAFGTTLNAACRSGNMELVQLLISSGSDINQADRMGMTPLKVACREGNEKMIRLLLDKGGDVNQDGSFRDTQLRPVCMENNEKTVQLHINNGSDVNIANYMEVKYPIAECREENEKTVQLLSDNGSNLNRARYLKETPLTAACRGGNAEIVQLLLDNGCDVNAPDCFGTTPLVTACEVRSEKIVRLLLNKGCNVNQADTKGQTPLTSACRGGNENIVELLIKNGCDVNQSGILAYNA